MFSGQSLAGAAPSEADMSTSASIFGHTITGVIPAQAQGSTSPNLQAHSLAGVSRQQILMNVMALCSQTNEHASVESKLDSMTKLVGQMAQLLLMEHSSSTGSSLSWVTTSSSGSNPAVAAAGSAAVSRPAVKLFRCPVCPSHKAPLTEKGFYKHVLAWKKIKTGRRRSQCPGIQRSCLMGAEPAQVIDATMQLINPGANLAHGGGTGNHLKVADYFASVIRPK
jgi:hypothetical protein